MDGFTLSNAGAEYLGSLVAGIGLILGGLVLRAAVLTGVLVFVATGTGLNTVARSWFLNAAMLVPAAVSLWGYWKFTTPDPAFAARESSTCARRIVRAAVIVQACATGSKLLLGFAGYSAQLAPNMPRAQLMGNIFVLAALLVVLAAWLVQVAAAMSYCEWIADRAGAHDLARKSRRYRWLLPVLYVPGLLITGIACPIGLFLYIKLLVRLRRAVLRAGMLESPSTFAAP